MDFEDFVDSAAKPEDGLRNLNELVDEVELLEQQADELEEALKSLHGRRNYLLTHLIPDAMTNIQAEEWKAPSGAKVKMTNFVSGALPKEPEPREKALQWVESNGGEPLLKGSLEVMFSKSQHNEALSLKAELLAKGYAASYTPTIHNQTLLAFVREKLRRGDEVPFETLGIYSARIAQITHPQKRKKDNG